LNPDFPKGYSRKGLAQFSLGQYAEAKETYEKGLKIDGNNQQCKDGLQQIEQVTRCKAAAPPQPKPNAPPAPQLSPEEEEQLKAAKSKADKLSAAVSIMRKRPASAEVQAQMCEVIRHSVYKDQAAQVHIFPFVVCFCSVISSISTIDISLSQ
jgi:hypothetical protein